MKTIKFFTALLFASLLCQAAFAGQPRLLQDKYAQEGVASSFKVGGDWFPFPAYSDRAGWTSLFNALDGGQGTVIPDIIAKGEKYLDYKWQHIPATAYFEFERSGDRNIMQDPNSANQNALMSLIMAELAEGKGRFMDKIADALWFQTERHCWMLSAHTFRQSTGRALPDIREKYIDLGSGTLGAIMAVADFLLKDELDRIDPAISYTVEYAIKEKILDPYLNDKMDKPGNWWLGFHYKETNDVVNNWDPWCNSNVLLCFLLLEKDQARLDRAVEKSVRSVDCYLKFVQEDGACEEGPSYWGNAPGKLYDYLRIMYDASNGKLDIFDAPQVKDMGEYISRAFVGDGYMINFADAGARVSIASNIVWRYGKAVGSKEMTDLALFALADEKEQIFRMPSSIGYGDIVRTLFDLRTVPEIRESVARLNAENAPFEKKMADLRKEVPSSTWYPQTEHAYLRNNTGWFLGAKGGYNNESHNHNDAGTFLLYINNEPVLIDAGVGTYTRQTFSGERYSIWSMQSDWHNVPVINGASQHNGWEYKASDATCDIKKGVMSLDIANSYKDAFCKNWKRTFTLSDNSLRISDSYKLEKRVGADIWHFLVQGDVIQPGETYEGYKVKAGELLIACKDGKTVVKMTYPKNLTLSVDVKELTDPSFTRVWGPSLRRIGLSDSDSSPVSGKVEFTIRKF